MKGVVLAGGLGTRLRPLTHVLNKHLLPVYNRPMVYYPIQCLRNAGIEEVMIVTGEAHAGAFFDLLRNGEAFGLRKLEYAYQEGSRGIADALRYAETFSGGEDLCVILGDNIIEKNIIDAAERFRGQGGGAKIMVTESPEPERFGVVLFEGEGRSRRIVDIAEKPSDPTARTVATGIYFYDAEVFDVIRSLSPSVRGEYEITDVNRAYLEAGTLTYDELDGWWMDVGTHEALLEASNLVRETGANNVDESPRNAGRYAGA